MSRKGKIEVEEKIKVVCECLEGELSQTQAAESPAFAELFRQTAVVNSKRVDRRFAYDVEY